MPSKWTRVPSHLFPNDFCLLRYRVRWWKLRTCLKMLSVKKTYAALPGATVGLNCYGKWQKKRKITGEMLSYGALLLARLDRKYEIHLPMLTADIKESKAGHLTLPPLPSLSCESQISLLGRKTLLVILISRYRDLEISEGSGGCPSFVRICDTSNWPFIGNFSLLPGYEPTILSSAEWSFSVAPQI